jgi:hypothetical protein
VLDDGQDVLALPVQGDGLDEITGQQGVGLRAQEVGPRGGRPLGCRVKAFLFEDLPDRGRCDLDAERYELPMLCRSNIESRGLTWGFSILLGLAPSC